MPNAVVQQTSPKITSRVVREVLVRDMVPFPTMKRFWRNLIPRLWLSFPQLFIELLFHRIGQVFAFEILKILSVRNWIICLIFWQDRTSITGLDTGHANGKKKMKSYLKSQTVGQTTQKLQHRHHQEHLSEQISPQMRLVVTIPSLGLQPTDGKLSLSSQTNRYD